MIFLPLIALLIGVALGVILKVSPVHGVNGQYLAVGCLAGLDTVFGGIRSGLEGKFRNDVFVTGFISNIAIAFLLAWIGDQIYLDLYIAVALVLGTRIYTNLSLIRRFALTRWSDIRERRKLQALAQSVTSQQPEVNP